MIKLSKFEQIAILIVGISNISVIAVLTLVFSISCLMGYDVITINVYHERELEFVIFTILLTFNIYYYRGLYRAFKEDKCY